MRNLIRHLRKWECKNIQMEDVQNEEKIFKYCRNANS